MKADDPEVDRIVEELMDKKLPKSERMSLLRELVQRGEELPDEMFEVALQRLMERLTD